MSLTCQKMVFKKKVKSSFWVDIFPGVEILPLPLELDLITLIKSLSVFGLRSYSGRKIGKLTPLNGCNRDTDNYE